MNDAKELKPVRTVGSVTRSEPSFLRELEDLINKHSKENGSDTPDFILAQYLNNCLENFNIAQQQRSDWFRDMVEHRPPLERKE